MSTVTEPVSPDREQAEEICRALSAASEREGFSPHRVVDEARLDLTDAQVAWAVEAGYAIRSWKDRLLVPDLAKEYAYQPGSPDEYYRVDISLDPRFSPAGREIPDARLLRLGRASVDHRDDRVLIKCYTPTGTRDVDHAVARTAHLELDAVRVELLDRGAVEMTGFLVGSLMYPTGVDTDTGTRSGREAEMCDRCEEPHAWTDDWLPPESLLHEAVRVKVVLVPADSGPDT